MELRILRNFIAVVEEEGVSAAADALRISQPALSRQIKDLEDEVGATLFVRGNRSRSLELTEKGRLMYRRAQEIVELADRTQKEMTADEDIAGDVHIAAAQSAAMRIVARSASAPGGTSHDTTAAQASASPRAAARRLWAEYH